MFAVSSQNFAWKPYHGSLGKCANNVPAAWIDDGTDARFEFPMAASTDDSAG